MSGNLQLYTLLFGAINGSLLAEEQQIDVSRTANAAIVNTVAKGFAGVSPGAAMTEVDVKNAVPQGGFEIDFGPNIAGLIPVSVQVIGPGGTAMKSQAFVLSDTLRHGVNQEASYDFKAVMPLALFKK
jgi:hypothetical protein